MTGDRGVPVAVPVGWSNAQQSTMSGGLPAHSRATTTNASRRRLSSHTGRRGLAVVAGSLSARDWAVLKGVARHRYLTTRQVEGFWFHDHATPLAGARVCRRVLRRLSDLHILTPLERRIGGIRAGSASFIWRIGVLGDRLLREETSNPRQRQREPGQLFLRHCLAVADAHLSLVRSHRAGALELVTVQTEPDCWRSYTGLGGARLVLQPDLHAVTGDPSDAAFVDCWFIEIDRGSEHPKRLLAKCARYEAYRHSGIEQADSGSFPLVVWVMQTPAHAERLITAIQQDQGLDDRLFRVTTAEHIAQLIAGGVA
jgi:Replication-relaxation